ncbi:MAG: hypothetical protein FWD05_01330 [Oscillospiraceae bacterium]|nr:hypothetical protein [Oscillospiraceae bacterium]
MNKFILTGECATRSSFGKPRVIREMTIPFRGRFVSKDFRKEWSLI